MTIYYALVFDKKHLVQDADTGQLEIYESKEHAIANMVEGMKIVLVNIATCEYKIETDNPADIEYDEFVDNIRVRS